RLKSLAGGVLPDEQRVAAERGRKLPESALKALGPLLGPTVLQPVTPQLGEQLSHFCLQHEIAEADLGHLLKACRWLLREAAAANVTRAELEADIAAVWPEPGALGEVLLEHYEPIKQSLRVQLVSDALVKHGNVLVDVDWRIDQLRSERHAARLDVPIAVVTLAHRSADDQGRLTLQLTPTDLQNLASVFTALAQKTRLASPKAGTPKS
ncbi:MAG TPA: hypothetical protein ENK57_12505, partial [Polyangiaceae bacterium]|nr:hypothetical protein [Polyangiaceae bacterium]